MPNTIDRRGTKQKRTWLEHRYQSLKAQIHEISHRRTLSAEEQLMVSAMKREKLAMKDALDRAL